MTFQQIMKICLFVGLTLVIIGISLASFTDLTVSMGADGIVMISLIIGLGLLLLLPSKIYLTLLFFQKESELKERKAKNKNDKDKKN